MAIKPPFPNRNQIILSLLKTLPVAPFPLRINTTSLVMSDMFPCHVCLFPSPLLCLHLVFSVLSPITLDTLAFFLQCNTLAPPQGLCTSCII